jgi:hypothetical protein
LIIDEFGFDKLERREYPESPSLLYKVVDSRNGHGSTAFVTQGDQGLVESLFRILGGPILATSWGTAPRVCRAWPDSWPTLLGTRSHSSLDNRSWVGP